MIAAIVPRSLRNPFGRLAVPSSGTGDSSSFAKLARAFIPVAPDTTAPEAMNSRRDTKRMFFSLGCEFICGK